MKYMNICIGGLLLCGLTACEKDLPVYETPVCELNFDYGKGEMSTDFVTEGMRAISHSFILDSKEGQDIDTVWVKVTTMGFVSPENRKISLQQIMTGENDAVAGKHYVAFDDPELTARFYYIPAHQAEARLPVVIKRDPSLAAGDVTLKFAFRENEYFKLGYPEFGYQVLTISDKLAKPSMWDDCLLDYFLGAYGPVKHELMIGWTHEKWDNTYLASIFYEMVFDDGSSFWNWKDENYFYYLVSWFNEKLATENAERLENPAIGDVWREADGQPVDFTPLSPDDEF